MAGHSCFMELEILPQANCKSGSRFNALRMQCFQRLFITVLTVTWLVLHGI